MLQLIREPIIAIGDDNLSINTSKLYLIASRECLYVPNESQKILLISVSCCCDEKCSFTMDETVIGICIGPGVPPCIMTESSYQVKKRRH